jgi:uncharacterized membrane-anchored protein
MTGALKLENVRAPEWTVLSKVPEVTIWFWIIKILCTTVGESFADWINMKLGVGLEKTSLIFTVVLVVVLAWQVRLNRYTPFVYWLTVVVLSVTGTLYTDILTDDLHVPLALSTSVFAAVLAVVFGVWYAREGTLSIHSIVSLPREAFYWLAVLVTFALGTAAGDWTLELTGWGPGTSVLLPAELIVLIFAGWRLGANPVLSFWLAYILTRPLGANLGDWLASPTAEHGLGLGTAVTSVIFLAAILATVMYLSVTRSDVIKEYQQSHTRTETTRPGVERTMLGYFGVIALTTGLMLGWAAAQPHARAASEEDSAPVPTSTVQLSPMQATQHFPPAEIAKFRSITQDTLARLRSGDQAGATARVTDLETAWDDDQPTLEPRDETAWHFLDGRIDTVLRALRATHPDTATEKQALSALLNSLATSQQSSAPVPTPTDPLPSTQAAVQPPPTPAPVQPPPNQTTQHFPPAEIAKFRSITQDTLTKLRSGDQAGATARVTDLETAWDDDQPTLEPKDETAWHFLDGRIDAVLRALRATHPDTATEEQALTALLNSLA